MTDAVTAGTPALRFGLVGTGFWAGTTHAPALSSTPGIELAGVWGRDRDAARALALQHGVEVFSEIDEMLEGVDAVAFAVPPSVQCSTALRAVEAGKHVLLEKPIATSRSEADALVEAVERAKVASIVFLTHRFQLGVRSWLADVRAQRGWVGGVGAWLGTSLSADSPFNTPWRRDKGALWDLGPHAVSLMWAALGPVLDVRADSGRGDLAYLVLHHDSGATSMLSLTLGASAKAAGLDFFLWGDRGRSQAPIEEAPAVDALRVALSELAVNASSGLVDHECDVGFGRSLVHVLARAEEQLAIAP